MVSDKLHELSHVSLYFKLCPAFSANNNCNEEGTCFLDHFDWR